MFKERMRIKKKLTLSVTRRAPRRNPRFFIFVRYLRFALLCSSLGVRFLSSFLYVMLLVLHLFMRGFGILFNLAATESYI